MPIAAYFDAGGHEEDQEYLVVAGFAAPITSWIEFEISWRRRLLTDGLEYFHAVEFAHSRGQFAHNWKEDETRRRCLLSDLMDIVKQNVSRKFSSVVINDALNEMSESTKLQFHINAYSLSARTCAARLREWMQREHWENEPQLIFEAGDIGVDLLKKSLTRDGFPEPLFRAKRDQPTQDGSTLRAPTALQAADWLAYEVFLATKANEVRRWAMEQFLTTPGNIGVYEMRDVERLKQVLETPADQLLTGTLWDARRLT